VDDEEDDDRSRGEGGSDGASGEGEAVPALPFGLPLLLGPLFPLLGEGREEAAIHRLDLLGAEGLDVAGGVEEPLDEGRRGMERAYHGAGRRSCLTRW
jgi:hypothetical protein